MAITLVNAARSAACDAVVDLCDGGVGAGKLKLKSAGDVLLCTITLADPAFGAAANGVATAAGLPKSGTGLAQEPLRPSTTSPTRTTRSSGRAPSRRI